MSEPVTPDPDALYEAEYTPDDTKATVEDFERALAQQAPELAKVEEKPAEAPVEKPAETPEPTKPDISLELVAKAVRAGLDEEDIAEMTAPELGRAIRQAERMNRQLQELAEKLTPKETKQVADPDEDLLKTLDDETLVDPIVAKPIKALLAKFKALEAKQAETTPVLQKTEAAATRSRLESQIAEIDPELKKQFDVTTKQGVAAYNKLLSQMQAQVNFERETGEFVDEPVRLARALRAMDLMPAKKPAKKEVPQEVKETYTNGALAKGAERQGEKSIIEIIKEKRARWNAGGSKVAKQEDEEPADFLPG